MAIPVSCLEVSRYTFALTGGFEEGMEVVGLGFGGRDGGRAEVSCGGMREGEE